MRIRIHMIAPYEAMIPLIQECIPLFPHLDIKYSVGDLVKGVEIALAAEKNGAEVIISRGGTARLIKKEVTIPVIDMQLSGYDMIRSLTLASRYPDKTAIVGFSNITSGAQAIIDLMELPLTIYTVNHSDEVAPLLLELKAAGYRHIVGDVITFQTANTYGMNGFLMQSGKESIIKSLEDAQFVHGHLTKKDTVASIFRTLVLKEYPNLFIMNERGEAVFEHLTDFDHNPLSEEHIHLMNTNLSFHQSAITNSFIVNENELSVTAYEIAAANTSFKVYLIEKTEYNAFSQPGVTVCTNLPAEPLAAESQGMRTVLDRIEALYTRHEVIHLLGDAGSGKSFLAGYAHQQFAAGGVLLQIDLQQCPPEQLESIPLAKVRTVQLLHADQWADPFLLKPFIEACLSQQIGVFMLSEQALDSNFWRSIPSNTILVPPLSERAVDIPILVQHFLTEYYHQYGTKAVKIRDDALKLIIESVSGMTVRDLKLLMKQAALNENDYVLSLETLHKLLAQQQQAIDHLSLNGTLKEIEKEVINLVLKEENNNQSKAAERLGINRATLWRKLKE